MKDNTYYILDILIRSLYLKGNENNRNRAKLLVQCSSILFSSLQYIQCASRLDTNKRILLFRCNVISSMKSKVKKLIER